MDPQNQLTDKTDISLVIFRGKFIFLFILISLLLTASGAYVTGMESGQLPSKITSFKSSWQTALKSLQPIPTVAPLPLETFPTPTETPEPTAAPQPQQPVYYYPTYPTSTPFPTVVPGRPGSKEWENQFWQTWDAMSKKNAEMQQQVENAQKDFCNKNPSLCSK